jgi:putative transposase
MMTFFTATINLWQNLLHEDKMKDILINSFEYMVQSDKAKIHAFVIMPNHIHVLWTSLIPEYDLGGRFKSFTGYAFRNALLVDSHSHLQKYNSTQNDRHYHFLERRSLSI